MTAKLHKVVVTVVGQYAPPTVEAFIRANAVIREQTRGPQGRSPGLTAAVARQLHLFPRFARVRSSSLEDTVWFFSWPISQLDEAHARVLELIAQLLERRLNRPSGSGSDGVAQCELRVGRGFGSFVVEIRATSPLEIDAVEKRVFTAIDQLRDTVIDTVELQQASEQVNGAGNEFTQSALDRAWSATQRAFFSQTAQAVTKSAHVPTTERNIAQLIQRDLPRNNVAEILAEAAAPRKSLKSSLKGPNLAATSRRAKSRNHAPAVHNRGNPSGVARRNGRIYSVQKGESLQMIAHRYHVTIADIIHANGLMHPDQLRPGTEIVIPVSSPFSPTTK